MAQIGTFTRDEDGSYTGTIRTLSLNIKVRFVPAEPSQNEKAPEPARAGGQQCRDRCGLEADVEGEHRVSLGEARRPVLPGTDLRQPRRVRRQLRARLVALTRPAPQGRGAASAAAFHARDYAERGELKMPGKAQLTRRHSA